MTSITTRAVTPDDLPELLTMVHALATHHDDPPVLTLDHLRRDVIGTPPWATAIVAQQGARLVGYAALCPLMQLQFGVRGMDFHHLFVAKDMRGQGVGRLLIDASIQCAKSKGCAYVTVGTHPDNQRAADIYRAAGFDDLPTPGPRFRLKL